MLVELSSQFNEVILNPEGRVDKAAMPFEYRKVDGEGVIFLPTNFKEFECKPFLVGLADVLRRFVNVVFEDTPIEIKTKVNSDVKNFWIGFFRTLTRDPEENETANFSGIDPLSIGANSAKVLILRLCLKSEEQKYLNYLPQHMFYGEGRIDKINYMISETIISNELKVLQQARQNLMRILQLYIKSSEIIPKWKDLLLSYKIPTNVITPLLYPKKEKSIKGKKKFVLVKPRKPSKRVEALLSSEIQIIKADESSFTDFKNLINNYKEGIPLDVINKVVSEMKSLTAQKKQVVQRWTAPLTSRGKAIIKVGKTFDNKFNKLSKKGIQDVLINVAGRISTISGEDRLSMSSYSILVNSKLLDTKLLNAYKNLILGEKLFESLNILRNSDKWSLIEENLTENIGTFGFQIDFEKIDEDQAKKLARLRKSIREDLLPEGEEDLFGENH